MLIEVKVKVTRNIDGKPRKKLETYLVDMEFFSEAEYSVTAALTREQAESFEIQTLKISQIKEIYNSSGEHSFIATLRDIFHTDDGVEKQMKYKVLLWANDLTQANQRTQELAREGYDMLIEGIKQVDYQYIIPVENGEHESN